MKGNFWIVVVMSFLPFSRVAAQIGGAFGVGDEVLHLGELLDVAVDLLVQHAAVGHHDHGVEEVRLPRALVEFDELVGQPGDAVAFAGARAVLDEVATAHAFAAAPDRRSFRTTWS
jgi:hypothetical protein